MSDFKFSCPTCGQHIACDTSNVGMQIPCPGCQTLLTVPPAPEMAPPAAPPGLSIAASQARHTANEASHHAQMPVHEPIHQTASGQARAATTSGLAIASFICSLFACVGCIPGIICGHLARRGMKRDPNLKGAGFALAGLIISYLTLASTILFVAVGAATVMKAFKEGLAQAKQESSLNVSNSSSISINSTAGDSLWNLNLTTAQFPDHPAAGKLHGVAFTVDNAIAQNGIIILRQGQDAATALQVGIFTLMTNGETLAGKTYDISTTDPDLAGGTMPNIHVRWRDESQNENKTKVFKTGFALKLELGQPDAGGKLPGKIYLCLPDPEKSYVAGTFDLEVKKSATKPKKPKKPASV